MQNNQALCGQLCALFGGFIQEWRRPLKRQDQECFVVASGLGFWWPEVVLLAHKWRQTPKFCHLFHRVIPQRVRHCSSPFRLALCGRQQFIRNSCLTFDRLDQYAEQIAIGSAKKRQYADLCPCRAQFILVPLGSQLRIFGRSQFKRILDSKKQLRVQAAPGLLRRSLNSRLELVRHAQRVTRCLVSISSHSSIVDVK